MPERTPLLHYRLSTSVNESDLRYPLSGQAQEQRPGNSRQRAAHQQQPQKLSVFFGVVIPTLLSMFSVVVFLRIGEFWWDGPPLSPQQSYAKPQSNPGILMFSRLLEKVNNA